MVALVDGREPSAKRGEVGLAATTRPPLTRGRVTTYVLLAIVTLGVVVCAWLAWPFVAGLTWATALAVLAQPLHQRLRRRIANKNIAAAASAALVCIGILVPVVLIVSNLSSQISTGIDKVQEIEENGGISAVLNGDSRLGHALAWLEMRVDLSQGLMQATEALRNRAAQWAGSAVNGVVNALVAVFLLFYFFRDRDQAAGQLRELLPLSDNEANYLFGRVRDTIQSTVYGTVGVAMVQGALGGLMFWFLGLPGPVLWGAVMGLLAIIPVLGAFVIWVPAAVYLVLQGSVWKAVILAVWGTLVVGLIDNLLYPIFVGNKTRMHTAPSFIAIIGGLAVLGVAGIVLGPLALIVTWSLIQILRKRTAAGRSAEQRV